MGEHYIGVGAVVGIAANADSSGTYWGGTPGTAVNVRIKPGGLKWSEVTPQEGVEEMRTDEAHNATGGTYYKGSVEMVASYIGMELWIQALMDGSITTTGGTGAPYIHTQALAESPLRYSTVTYYRQLRNGSDISLAFANAKITLAKFSFAQGGAGVVSFDWIAATMTAGTTAAPAPTECEPILFSHLSSGALSLNSVTTHRAKSVSFEIAAPSTEGEFGQSGVLDHIERSGQRTVSFETELFHDADVDTLMALKTGIPITLTFDNGGATTAEREMTLTLPAAFREGREETGGVWGMETVSGKWINRSTSAWGFVTKNSDSAIP